MKDLGEQDEEALQETILSALQFCNTAGVRPVSIEARNELMATADMVATALKVNPEALAPRTREFLENFVEAARTIAAVCRFQESVAYTKLNPESLKGM